MTPHPPLPLAPHAWGRALLRGLASWWHLVRFAAIVLVLALSPSTYGGTHRANLSRHLYSSAWQVLPWFTVLAALLSLVLIRIVLVTAQSYGLSHLALEMVVRVLVIELIPLSAALFVALRAGVAGGTVPVAAGQALGLAQLRNDLVPRSIAIAFSVLALTVVSCVTALVLAYLSVHGFTLWGLQGYTHTVGQVFDLPVTLGFMAKAVFFSLAVAIVPIAASLEATHGHISGSAMQAGTVRLFLVLLWIEAASLVVKYV